MNRWTSFETRSLSGEDDDKISLTTAALFILFGGGAGFAVVTLFCFLTFGANTEDAVAVMKGLKLVTLSYLVLQFFYLFAVELDQSAASRTD